jgi:hypothetical protein
LVTECLENLTAAAAAAAAAAATTTTKSPQQPHQFSSISFQYLFIYVPTQQ